MNKFMNTLKNLLEEFSQKQCILCDNFLSEMIFLKNCLCENCQNDLGMGKSFQISSEEKMANVMCMTKCEEKSKKLYSILKEGHFEGLNRSVAALYSMFIVKKIKLAEIDIVIPHPPIVGEFLTTASAFREEIVRTIGKNLGIIVYADLFKIAENGYEVDMPEVVKNKRILMIEVILDADFSRRCFEILLKYDVAKLEVVALFSK